MSKLKKLRSAPTRFFTESSSPWLRAVGGVIGPRIERSDRAMALLEDPVEALAEDGPPGLSHLAARARRRRRERRRARLRRQGEPRVSVVTAARDAERTIEASMRSILAQTYPHLELIVVDDGSDDATGERAEAIDDPRVTVVRGASPRGAAQARNEGLARARGDYVTFQDADDLSHPERIERQLDALLRAPGAVLCVCNYVRETATGRRLTVNGRRVAKHRLSMLFDRRAVIDRVGYMEPLRIGEDTEYHERIRAAFGLEREVHLFATLYRARFEPDSLLFASGRAELDDRDLRFAPDPAAQAVVDEALARLEARARAGESLHVPYDPARRAPKG